MIYNRKLKKLILICTGVVFLSFPVIDYNLAPEPAPSVLMYTIAVIAGIGYIVYGILYKTD